MKDLLVEPFIPYLLFNLALYSTPGPSTLSIAASGAAFGLRKSIPYILGSVVALVLVFIIVAFGIGVVFSKYPLVHNIFKWLSLIYIFYLACKIAESPLESSNETRHLGFVEGLPIVLINPKAYVAVILTITQFVDQEQFYSSLIKIIIWTNILAFATDLIWCASGQWIKTRLHASKASKYINMAFAFMLIVSVLIVTFI